MPRSPRRESAGKARGFIVDLGSKLSAAARDSQQLTLTLASVDPNDPSARAPDVRHGPIHLVHQPAAH
jgi:hypothetical protein